jgi:NADH-quinone oxidoreductase subunit D
MTATTDRQRLAYANAQAADGRVNLEFETDEGMTLNMGPQHPATHGTLRIVVKLDGEQVLSCEPVMGYMHRGYEKLTEVRTYPQVTALVNRIDWLGSFANEVPFILASERLMGIEAPPRAQWIRTILFEMSRIANISLFVGDMALHIGAMTAAFYAFRDREFVLNQIESATGGRFHPNFDRIGGLKDDLPKGWIADTKSAMETIRDFCDEMETLVEGNEIFQARTRGVGIIPADIALQFGLTGANLRSSGVDWDLRRDQPVGLAWNEVDWNVITHPDGDLAAYLDSLEVLLRVVHEHGVIAILPGHGPVVDDPEGVLRHYREHRHQRLDQVREALRHGDRTPAEVVARVYADVHRSVWPAAEQSVRAQLDYLHHHP